MSPPPQPPPPASELLAYCAALQAALQPPTGAAAALPGPSSLGMQRSLSRPLASSLAATSASLLALVQRIAAAAGHKDEIDALDLQGARLEGVGDVVDALLEAADRALDEHAGRTPLRRAAAAATTTAQPEAAAKGKSTSAALAGGYPPGPLPASILNAPISPLPQTLFARADNSRERAWSHSLVSKPHAITPLADTPRPDSSVPIKAPRAGMYCAEGAPRENPYYDEIHAFSAPEHALQAPAQPEAPPPIDGLRPTAGPTPFTWVGTLAQLEELRLHLLEERVTEIALDVEHHNYRSYQGLVCLVQLSTRFGDYIIDALSPAVRANFHILNDALADPAKVKVLHGAEHDVLWLQRDLNAYLVGLFDTYHAASILSYPAKSLAYLLQRHTNFDADKRWQLADWRIRPLPAPMLYYARADTHSLLYVYDVMRAELAALGGGSAGEPLRHVFERSKKTAARTYAKEEWDPQGEGREGWRTMWKRAGGDEARGVDERWEKEGIDGLGRTERLWRRLHDWRDRCARENDESTRYILSTANLLSLASRAPQTAQAVAACVGPALKKRSAELAREIADETAAWEKAAAAREERQKAQLALAQTQGQGEEEVGETVARPELGATPQPAIGDVEMKHAQGRSSPTPSVVTSLWEQFNSPPSPPLSPAPSAAAASSSSKPSSAVRSLTASLFGRKKASAASAAAAPAAVVAAPAASSSSAPAPLSPFARPLAPLPQSQALRQQGAAQTQAQKIKRGLGGAIRGLLAGTTRAKMGGEEAAQSAADVEMAPAAAAAARAAPAPAPAAAVAAPATPAAAPAAAAAEPEGDDDDSVVQVGKKRKKERWSKEARRASKKARADAEEAAAADAGSSTAPAPVAAAAQPEAPPAKFSYDNVPSILDAPQPERAPAGNRKEKSKKKKKTGGAPDEEKKERSLATVSTSRKRSEMSGGGKSASFAR